MQLLHSYYHCRLAKKQANKLTMSQFYKVDQSYSGGQAFPQLEFAPTLNKLVIIHIKNNQTFLNISIWNKHSNHTLLGHTLLDHTLLDHTLFISNNMANSYLYLCLYLYLLKVSCVVPLSLTVDRFRQNTVDESGPRTILTNFLCQLVELKHPHITSLAVNLTRTLCSQSEPIAKTH